MQLPVKITYRGLEKSDQIDNLVLDYAARLEKFCDHINRCDVASSKPITPIKREIRTGVASM